MFSPSGACQGDATGEVTGDQLCSETSPGLRPADPPPSAAVKLTGEDVACPFADPEYAFSYADGPDGAAVQCKTPSSKMVSCMLPTMVAFEFADCQGNRRENSKGVRGNAWNIRKISRFLLLFQI